MKNDFLRVMLSIDFIGEASRLRFRRDVPRMRGRLGPAQATVATAHAIARVVYRMLKYKIEYETISIEEYEKQYKEQQLKYMKKKAAKLGYQLTPA